MHIHLHVESPLEETIEVFNKVTEHFNYENIALQALPYYDLVNNHKALYLKSQIKGAYADIGLHHNGETQEYYEDQIKIAYACGCDGVKLFEGKPQYRKELGIALDDSRFDKFYAFLEEKQLPVVMHFGDPREFWDIERIPKWALERGWLYDESFVHFNAAQQEVEGILEKFPKLHLILAHFFFVSDDINYAERFIGSEGTLGIITKAQIRIFDQPEVRRFRGFLFQDMTGAFKASRELLQKFKPSVMRLYDEAETASLIKKIVGVERKGAFMNIAYEGVKEKVDVEEKILLDTFKKYGAEDLGSEYGEKWWKEKITFFYPGHTSII